MTGEQLGGTDLPIWYDVSQTKSGTNGVPNEGNVGHGTWDNLSKRGTVPLKVGQSGHGQSQLLYPLLCMSVLGKNVAI